MSHERTCLVDERIDVVQRAVMAADRIKPRAGSRKTAARAPARGLVAGAAALVCTSVLIAGVMADLAGAATVGHNLTVYTVATGVQFINTADDRARGARNNPLDAAANKLAPKFKETGNGPFAGDVAVYGFDMFTSATLKKQAGSASYTCYFNYEKHALCVAYFELRGRSGTIVASGPVNFNGSGFELVVTGGTLKYLGARGALKAVSAARNSQRIDFVLLG